MCEEAVVDPGRSLHLVTCCKAAVSGVEKLGEDGREPKHIDPGAK